MKEMKLEVIISLSLPQYSVISGALAPDLENESARSSVGCEEKDNRFYIYIRAADNVALRAALGTVTRQLITARNVVKGVK
ncbi:MAG: CTAG/PCC1 family protein [Candidatus Thermoplasmatota archaeon]|nr:CTAG/PCC1 family protein [Candidatus Thermoplasmatota archaeon]